MRRHLLVPMLSILTLLIATLANGSVPVTAQMEEGKVPAPRLTTNQSDSVTDNTYTSPQFGYRVSWNDPWALGAEPVSKPGEYDDMWLTTNNGHFDYLGIFTPLDETGVIDLYLKILEEDRPEVEVVRNNLNWDSQSPVLLSYLEGGVPMTEAVTAIPLVPGKSMLVVIQSLPSGMAYQERIDLENGVNLDVSGAATSTGNSTSESAASTRSREGQTTEVKNDPEKVYREIYTVSVYCEEVARYIVVYGFCDWPTDLPSSASCIEDPLSVTVSGTTYLCKSRYLQSDVSHPDEVTLENAPQKIYTVEVRCKNVTEQFGTVYGDCDWPLMGPRKDCIEDNSKFPIGDERYYLCKP